ncbi:outer membrane protein assembly factor BamE [Hasllibacter sp. MH4015]|uniref:outer membrane protein assembly factor BamE n=1 Tax=Hasllibacter sp. MH4015 TaxID=2854029 RepID=UPI001CD70D5A|nr:outer membrane protein assembly factor BamE [Hasllibacter sp. MH4015]
MKRQSSFPMVRPLALALGLVLGLAACSATYTNHGYVPPPEILAEIGVGATQEQVAELAGAPGSAGVMRDEAWFYTQYRVRNFTYNAPQVIERDIVAISFNEAGRVSNIERFGLEDGQIIQLSRRVTESSVRDIGFLRQILSNFGRINLGDALAN